MSAVPEVFLASCATFLCQHGIRPGAFTAPFVRVQNGQSTGQLVSLFEIDGDPAQFYVCISVPWSDILFGACPMYITSPYVDKLVLANIPAQLISHLADQFAADIAAGTRH